jgi:hypothetical protein
VTADKGMNPFSFIGEWGHEQPAVPENDNYPFTPQVKGLRDFSAHDPDSHCAIKNPDGKVDERWEESCGLPVFNSAPDILDLLFHQF